MNKLTPRRPAIDFSPEMAEHPVERWRERLERLAGDYAAARERALTEPGNYSEAKMFLAQDALLAHARRRPHIAAAEGRS